MSYTPLDTTVEDQQAGHLTDTNTLHTWCNAFHSASVTDVTLADTHGVVIVDSSAAARVITLPSAATAGEAGFVIIRDGANTVTVNCAGSDTFNDASTSKVLATSGDVLGIVAKASGTKWFITGERGSVV